MVCDIVGMGVIGALLSGWNRKQARKGGNDWIGLEWTELSTSELPYKKMKHQRVDRQNGGGLSTSLSPPQLPRR